MKMGRLSKDSRCSYSMRDRTDSDMSSTEENYVRKVPIEILA